MTRLLPMKRKPFLRSFSSELLVEGNKLLQRRVATIVFPQRVAALQEACARRANQLALKLTPARFLAATSFPGKLLKK